jgi:hypothetical protein
MPAEKIPDTMKLTSRVAVRKFVRALGLAVIGESVQCHAPGDDSGQLRTLSPAACVALTWGIRDALDPSTMDERLAMMWPPNAEGSEAIGMPTTDRTRGRTESLRRARSRGPSGVFLAPTGG